MFTKHFRTLCGVRVINIPLCGIMHTPPQLNNRKSYLQNCPFGSVLFEPVLPPPGQYHHRHHLHTIFFSLIITYLFDQSGVLNRLGRITFKTPVTKLPRACYITSPRIPPPPLSVFHIGGFRLRKKRGPNCRTLMAQRAQSMSGLYKGRRRNPQGWPKTRRKSISSKLLDRDGLHPRHTHSHPLF